MISVDLLVVLLANVAAARRMRFAFSADEWQASLEDLRAATERYMELCRQCGVVTVDNFAALLYPYCYLPYRIPCFCATYREE